ncbi:MAG: TIGR03084 family metal-binding protein [Myxococcota bacterium]
MFQQPFDCRDESDALHALIAPLSDADFARKTQFKDWSVHDVVAHLHMWNWAADLALRDGDAFRAFWAELAAGFARGRTFVQVTDAWLDGARNRKVLDLWRAFYPEMAERFAAADPKARVPWAGPDMSVRSSITARLMETWAHGQEVYDLLGVTRVDTDRIRNIAILGMNTFGWTFMNRAREVPAQVPCVRLEAPSGAIWEWNAEVQSDRVEGSATEFCQVVTQVRNIADTTLRVTGDAARAWMAIAQCFAGPPSDPPAPGTRGQA